MINYLKKGHKLTVEIESRQKVIDSLRSRIVVKAIDYSKDKLQGGSKDPDSNIIRILDKIIKEENEINSLNNELLVIIDAINALDSIDERTLLRLRYILGYKWEEVNEEMNISERTAGRIHRSALKNIKKILKL